MQSFIARKNKTVHRTTIAALLGMLFYIGLAPAAAAVDTQIGVSVCGQDSSGASITITQPLSDSVVNQSVVTFRGNANNAAQIEVKVDNQYSGTVAIGANQSTFATDVSLSQGTHTIEMTANDICGGQDATDSVVITYTPAASAPSNGGTIPTQVDSQPGTGSSGVTGAAIDKNDTHPNVQLPIIGPAVNMVTDFATTSGLGETFGSTNVVIGISRVGLTLVALVVTIIANSLAPVLARNVPGLGKQFKVTSHRSMLYLGWIIRGVGVLVMALAYFI